jgi:choline dehydrogenase-like flavoprotein
MIITASQLQEDRRVEADVCIVGSGAGGSVLAAGLTARGLRVVVLEEGGHYTARDFQRVDEAWSLPNLYQERGTRATADQAITVLQGRSVGGGTTVNWTTCFRTPDAVLAHWREHHGSTLRPEDLAPHFAAVEERLGITTWEEAPPNGNNAALARGARALGLEWHRTRRNVRGCQDSGLCGFGCPYDAKQAMAITYLADAVQAGADVYADVRAVGLRRDGRRIVGVDAVVLEPGRDRAAGPRVTVDARVVVVSGGAINSPALLLRSGLTRGPVGRRTFLHPVVSVVGLYDQRVDGWRGAPQSVTSHATLDRGAGELGYFLEAAPVHPVLAAVSAPFTGAPLFEVMGGLGHLSSLIALAVDGFAPGDVGGVVSLRRDGRVRLDYPVTPALVRAFRAAHETLARVHFAAGAREVATLHSEPLRLTSADELGRLDERAYGALRHSIFTAHQMGGCAMGPDPATSVVDGDLRHHDLDNLFVVDGSVLPTSLGVNPSETVYGLAHRARDAVASAAR